MISLFCGMTVTAQVPFPHVANSNSNSNSNSSAERVANFKSSDAPYDFLEITNSTHYPGQFISSIWAHQQGDNRYALRIFALTISNHDSGDTPVMVFRSDLRNRLNLNAPQGGHLPWGTDFLPISRRPVFGWENGDTQLTRILVNGNIRINTIYPTEKLHVNGGVRFENIPTIGSNVLTQTLVVDSSGKVYKRSLIIAPPLSTTATTSEIKDALATINSLEGVELGSGNLNTEFVLSLTEMEKTLPSLVKGEGNEKEISYIEVIPILVEAIKEQQRQIKILQETLNNKTNNTEKLDKEYEVKITKVYPNPVTNTATIYLNSEKVFRTLD